MLKAVGTQEIKRKGQHDLQQFIFKWKKYKYPLWQAAIRVHYLFRSLLLLWAQDGLTSTKLNFLHCLDFECLQMSAEKKLHFLVTIYSHLAQLWLSHYKLYIIMLMHYCICLSLNYSKSMWFSITTVVFHGIFPIHESILWSSVFPCIWERALVCVVCRAACCADVECKPVQKNKMMLVQ